MFFFFFSGGVKYPGHVMSIIPLNIFLTVFLLCDVPHYAN